LTAQLQDPQLVQENNTLLQELQIVKKQLQDKHHGRSSRSNHFSQQHIDTQNERDNFSSEKEMLSIKVENHHLQEQMEQVLQEMNSLKEASATVLQISRAKSRTRIGEDTPQAPGARDIAFSMLSFVSFCLTQHLQY
jgi:hypothetical protein